MIHKCYIQNMTILNRSRPKTEEIDSLRLMVRWRSWLRHCATSRKVAGSIPDGVIGIFN